LVTSWGGARNSGGIVRVLAATSVSLTSRFSIRYGWLLTRTIAIDPSVAPFIASAAAFTPTARASLASIGDGSGQHRCMYPSVSARTRGGLPLGLLIRSLIRFA